MIRFYTIRLDSTRLKFSDLQGPKSDFKNSFTCLFKEFSRIELEGSKAEADSTTELCKQILKKLWERALVRVHSILMWEHKLALREFLKMDSRLRNSLTKRRAAFTEEIPVVLQLY